MNLGFRRNCAEALRKKAVLNSFVKFKGKHLHWSPLFLQTSPKNLQLYQKSTPLQKFYTISIFTKFDGYALYKATNKKVTLLVN